MAEDASKVYVAKPRTGGAIWSAPISVALPQNATSDLATGYNSLGFISDAGITRTQANETNSIKAYGGKTVKTIQTDYKEDVKFSPIETNQYVLKEQFKEDNVTVETDGSMTVKHKADEKVARHYVIETLLDETDEGQWVQRTCLTGKITAIGDTTYSDGEPIAPEFTISTQPDTNGVYATDYIAFIPTVPMAKSKKE